MEKAPTERLVVERFEYRGFYGRHAFCKLEIIPVANGRTVVIATELADNPGTSITNVAEHLASYVCDRFGIDPGKLVWVEHYGYPPPGESRRERTYDLVTLKRRPPERIAWSPAVRRMHPDGWPGHFEEPHWRPMREQDWRLLDAPNRHCE